MAEHNKLVILATHGTEDPERATIPFAMGAAALASDVEVVIGLQSNGVWLGRKFAAEHVFAPGFPPLAKLMTDFLQLGGKLLICSPCLQARQLSGEHDLVEGAEIVAAARFVAEVMSATSTLTY